jgi:predicted kinase
MRGSDQSPAVGEPAGAGELCLTGRLLVLVSGLPGVGKSVLVDELAPRLGAVRVSRDAARLSLDSGRLRRLVEALAWRLAGRRLASTQRRAGQVLELSVAEHLASNRCVIVEAVAEDSLRARLRGLAVEHDAAFVQVECVLSDRAAHNRRLARRSEGEQFWRSVVDGLQRSYQPSPDCLRIDTGVAPAEAAARVLRFVSLD